MQTWKDITTQHASLTVAAKALADVPGVYAASIQTVDEGLLFMVKAGTDRELVVIGTEALIGLFSGVETLVGEKSALICPLTYENAQAMRKLLPWTAPSACGTTGVSIGLGDRLGLAGPGHVKTVVGRDVKPVLAQQSMRELDLTGRTYKDVLDAATWAVFQEGYTEGYGADGDHLKKAKDVADAVELGYSMITLDCSEHIDDGVSSRSAAEIEASYAAWPADERTQWETLYAGKTFVLDDGLEITFDPDHFPAMILVYGRALQFAEQIYHDIIAKAGREVDFEVSIDEVATPTTPQDHYFVAAELQRRGMKVASLAPRFCGEFQKAIDYIGDVKQFEQEFAVHAAIGRKFQYKVSIHSGSDKFTVYPIIGEYTKGNCHVKTAGTNWLEAIRVIAETAPDLYREMHAFALSKLDDARAFYHVTLDPEKIPALDTLSDDQLPALMDQNDARQAIHITYGFLLQERDAQGQYVYRDRFYQAMQQNASVYETRLQSHIGKHLDLLGKTK